MPGRIMLLTTSRPMFIRRAALALRYVFALLSLSGAFSLALPAQAQHIDSLVVQMERAAALQDAPAVVAAADAILKRRRADAADTPTLLALSFKTGALISLERYTAALPVATRAVEAAPMIPAFWSRRAYLYAELGQHDRAVDDLAIAIEWAVGDSALVRDLRRQWAFSLSEAGRHQESVEAYTELLAVTDQPAPILGARSEVRYRAGDVAGALADLADALALTPDSPLLLLSRVDIYLREERYEEARRDLDRSIALGPEAAGDALYGISMTNRAYVRRLSGEAEAAAADAEEGLRYMPDNPFAYRIRALLRLDAGDTPGACLDLGQAMLYGFYERFGPHYVYGPDVRTLLAEHCALDP